MVGGGIGFCLIQWIALNDVRAVGAAFIAIAIVVMTLDYVSAYYLNEQINSMVGYHRGGTAIWAIIIVVWALDFLSAEVRKRLT